MKVDRNELLLRQNHQTIIEIEELLFENGIDLQEDNFKIEDVTLEWMWELATLTHSLNYIHCDD